MEKENKKTIEIPFGAKDSELYKFEYTIPEGYEAEIKDGKVIMKKKESDDERIRTALLRCCDDWEKGQFGCMAKEDVPAIRAYLEKQKEQKPANSEKPNEWSEEDENKISELKAFIAKCNGFNKANRQKAFDMIDTLRPQPHWKPSKEQMDELREVIDLRRYLSPHLDSLYNDLKKL